MKNRLILIVLFIASCTCAHAETIVMRTGARVEGKVLIQNDEVVIVRDASGARFQYSRAEVEQIIADEKGTEEQENKTSDEPEIKTRKKVSALLELSGGAAVKGKQSAGGGVGADLIVGTHHIGNKHLLIGGGLGYHGYFFGKESYHFLPIQVALRMPFIEQKHAPVFGVSMGYGVALSKNYVGGLYAGVDFGYRCQLNHRTAVAVVASAQFQQAKVNTVETIEDVEFVNKTGCYLVTPAIKLALYF